MTPADHLPDVLRTLHAHLVTAALAAEVHALEVEQRRGICPLDGCLVLAGESCPACRVQAKLDARIVCLGCGTLEDPDEPCATCAGMRAAA